MPEKITISTEAGDTIQALFNPERYTVTKGVQFAEIGIPGMDSPVLQFVRGQNEKIQMELFFDTTDRGMIDPVTDVRTLSGQVYQLLKVDGDGSQQHTVVCELFDLCRVSQWAAPVEMRTGILQMD